MAFDIFTESKNKNQNKLKKPEIDFYIFTASKNSRLNNFRNKISIFMFFPLSEKQSQSLKFTIFYDI